MNRLRILGCFVFAVTQFVVLTHAQESGFNKAEFTARRAKLFEQISDGVAVVFAAEEPGAAPVKFRQSPDFYYLTGVEEPNAVAVFTGANKKTFIFANKKTKREIQFEGPGLLDSDNAKARYGVDDILPLEQINAYFGSVFGDARHLYLPVSLEDNLQQSRGEVRTAEGRRMAHPVYRQVSSLRMAIDNVRQLAPHVPVIDIGPILAKMRVVKSSYEIERMRKAAAIGVESVKEAIKGTHPGQYEYEVEARARYFTTKNGAGMAFTPIVASGPNTTALHYEQNNRKTEAGDVMLIDFGADYGYYVSDITRTWPVSGKFTPEEEKMYACVLDASDTVIAMMKPGVTLKNMQDVAYGIYKKHGFEKEFEEDGRYIGHYVGLSVHDVNPGLDVPLQAGATFNVEPLLTIESKKIHMRLEDSVLVTATGAENLTAGAPRKLNEIYALIKEKGLN